jgi:hypothetical protein
MTDKDVDWPGQLGHLRHASPLLDTHMTAYFPMLFWLDAPIVCPL